MAFFLAIRPSFCRINNQFSSLSPSVASKIVLSMTCVFFLVMCFVSTSATGIPSKSEGPAEVFTNHFYVELEKELPQSQVHRLAKRHGFVNLGPVRYSSE